MKLLVLSPVFPYPPHDGDRVRIFNFIKELSPKNDITLVSFAGKNEKKYEKKIKKYCAHAFPVEISRRHVYFNILKGMFSKKPLNVLAYESGAMRKTIRKVLSGEKFDGVFVYRLRMAAYAEDIRLPKIIDLVDSLALYMKRGLEFEKMTPRGIYNLVDFKKVLNYEKKMPGIFDFVTVNFEQDASFLGGKNVVAVPNGGYNPAAGKKKKQKKKKVIGFFGNLEYAPNADGLVYFYKNTWKKLKIFDKNIKLEVLGDRKGRFSYLEEDETVKVRGYVPDAGKIIKRWDVSVVPVRYGAGRQNKILQSWANRVPVVSTPFASKGVYGKNGKNLIIGKTPDSFARGVIKLIKDSRLRAKIIKNGEKTLKTNFSWKKSAGTINRLFRKTGKGEK